MSDVITDMTLEKILKGLDELEKRAHTLAEQVISDDVRRPPNFKSWIIIMRQKGQPAREFPLESRLNIGRAAGNDILLVDRWISRQHARIELVEGKPRIIDLGSGNGTFVNGERIAGPVWLDEETVVSFANIRLELSSGDEESNDSDSGLSIEVPIQPG